MCYETLAFFTFEKNGTMTFLVFSVTGQELFSARLSLVKGNF